MKNRMPASLLGLLITVVLFIVAITALNLYASQKTLPQGVSIDGWKPGRMSVDAFQSSLNDRISALGRLQIAMDSSVASIPGATATMDELGLQTNAAEIYNRIRTSLEGSIIEKAKKRMHMRNAFFSLYVSFDQKKLNAYIESKWAAVQAAQPVDAKRIIGSDDSITYVPERSVDRIDIELLLSRLTELISGEIWATSTFNTQLTMQLPLVKIAPKVTVATLKAEGITRKIAQFTTAYPQTGAGRNHNIQSTAKIVNDTFLAPGEVFDYQKIVKETEKQYGYREAPVILNGVLVPGIGGGICQVSTTLYNAVLRSGLEIVERRNHSLPISYAPLGQDATYSDGYLNFKFRNNTDTALIIRTQTTDRTITVKLFGSMPQNLTYEIRSNTVETLEPPIKYVRNTALPKGRQRVVQQGKSGYIVETFRYKKENGTIVAEERISRDTYQPQPKIIAIHLAGSGNRETGNHEGDNLNGNSAVIEDGISGPKFR